MSVRNLNTTSGGRSFSEQQKLAVWNKAKIIPGKNSREWRSDTCGAWMSWSKFGETVEKGFGWEIDHILPVSRGGTDDLSNLQALQWQNNRKKADNVQWNCAIVGPR